MADEIVKVVCPSCSTMYEIPSEYRGQSGECTQCGAIFDIPLSDDIMPVANEPMPETDEDISDAEEILSTTDTDQITPDESGVGSSETPQTNTVKLSRMKVGMVPKVSDNFTLDVVNKPAVATKTGIQIKRSPSASSSTKSQFPKVKPPEKKPWWKFW